ncbi:MAG: hypothetical protein MJ177_09150, partial [Clostridia bacterium]|nr:hypothetical protein [Clostridia bacterium]
IIVGLLWCVTIVGIPVGKQCFKIAKICLAPFGKDVDLSGKASSLILNICWIVFGGIELAAEAAVMGIICACTIVGIPLAKQYFKIAKVALLPFGAKIS